MTNSDNIEDLITTEPFQGSDHETVRFKIMCNWRVKNNFKKFDYYNVNYDEVRSYVRNMTSLKVETERVGLDSVNVESIWNNITAVFRNIKEK